MADNDTKPIKAASEPATTSADMLTQLRDALQGETVAVQRRERDALGRLLDSHDAQRAKLPKHTLTAVTDFTIVDDANPDGRTVKMGEEFEVSEFDLPRFLGKGLPRANEATPGGGVTVSQA